MKVAVLATALISAAVVRADAAEAVEDAASSASSAVESATVEVVKPTFTPTTLKAPFLEQFTDGWDKRWKASNAKKENDASSDEEWAYVGKWAVEEPTTYPGMVGDKGLVVKNKAAHHAISAKFPKKIDPKGKDLVVQYEVKLNNGLECGGAYLKLLQDNKALHREEFSNASPYVIMFGPDRCGTTNKVHFIFRHKNPKTGEYAEKHMRDPPFVDTGKTSNVYTLIVRKDNTYEMQINGEHKTSGSLLNDFTPAVNPDKEIDDPNDKKPEDWVDDARIADPDAKKPEDWDEDAPYEIVDTEAVKPEDWLDDEPSTIPDPEAVKPEDWDDEEDGDWVPPTVSNPKCEEASGCGKWEAPMKKNPDYKGKWTAPFIDNPAYKGVWRPRQIKNPDYFEDKHPSNFEPMGAIGFEIWTMQDGILFDNIYIGHSIDDAIALKNQTWDLKIKAERAQAEADKPKTPEPPKSPLDISFKDDPALYIREKANLFWTMAQRDPVEAIKTVPEIAGGAGLILLTILAVLSSLFLGGGSAAAAKDKAKDAAKKVSDKTAEAVTTGADKAQSEVTKRTTRSSQQ